MCYKENLTAEVFLLGIPWSFFKSKNIYKIVNRVLNRIMCLSIIPQRCRGNWRQNSTHFNITLHGGESSGLHSSCMKLKIKALWYSLTRRMSGPLSWSGCGSEQKNLCPAGNQTLNIQPVANHSTYWLS